MAPTSWETLRESRCPDVHYPHAHGLALDIFNGWAMSACLPGKGGVVENRPNCAESLLRKGGLVG